MSVISSLQIVNVVIPILKAFFWIPESVNDTAAVNPNGIKTLLANGLRTFFIKGKPVFSNSTRGLSKNSPCCPILCSWVLEYFILADEFFAKAWQSLKTFAVVNNNLCEELVSSLELPIAFDEGFKVAAVSFFNPDFYLLL